MLLTSASQHKTWKLCQRKWGIEKIDGHREPESEPLLFGSILHFLVEHWLVARYPFPTTNAERSNAINQFLAENKRGQLTVEGLAYFHKLFAQASDLSAVGVHLLPEPMSPALVVEGNIEMLTAGGKYRGARDWMTHDNKVHLDVIGDNKTTSGKKWALTPETLGSDVQAIIYAEEYFRKHPASTHVILRWVYFLKKGKPKAWTVEIVVERNAIHAKFMAEVEPNTAAMRDAKIRHKNGNELPPNLSGCRAFNKTCYFQTTGQCQLTDNERLTAVMTEPTNISSPSDLLAHLQAGTPAAAPVPVAVNPPVAAAPASVLAPQAVAPAPGPPPPPMPVAAAPALTAGSPAAAVPGISALVSQAPAIPALVPQAAPVPAAALLPPVGAVAPLSTPVAAAAAPVPQVPIVAPGPASEALEKKTRGKKFTLFVDCIPNKKHIFAHEIPELIVCAAQAAQHLKVVNYRCGEYGKGPATLTALVQAWLLDNPQSGAVVIDTRSSFGTDLLDAFTEAASEVVRGFR